MRVTRQAPLIFLAFLVSPTGAQALKVAVARQATANQAADAQSRSGPFAWFAFDGTIESSADTPLRDLEGEAPSYVEGLDGHAVSLGPDDPSSFLTLASGLQPLESSQDFSVQFWLRTEAGADRRFVVLSNKEFTDNSLMSQKKPGWVFYMSGGTWAWSLGSGSRRITYERDNGTRMPLNDGRWHQLTMSYSSRVG